MKQLAFALSFFMLTSNPGLAQDNGLKDPSPEKIKVQTCTESINGKLNKSSNSLQETKQISAVAIPLGGFIGIFTGLGAYETAAAANAAIAVGAASVMVPVIVIAGATAATLASIKKHRQNILEIFEGAASGGNSRTKKLWKLANKKNPEAFKKMTYEKFLENIHKADVSGEACQFEDVPERKEIIKVVLDIKDLEDPIVGEKETSKKETITDSSRSTQIQKNSVESQSGQQNAGSSASNQ